MATIGFFDGVHRGHQYLISQVKDEARQHGLQSTIVTFADHPARVLHPERPLRLLSTPTEKMELLGGTGVGHVALLPFTPELAQLTARDFMEQILQRLFCVRVLVIGYDHRFGHNRDEGFEDYVRHGREIGMDVVQARELDHDGLTAASVSSSAIRRLLLSGDIETANRCLGYDYQLHGTVVGGFQIGRRLGFPTANILPDSPDKLVPRCGVYAVRVTTEEGRQLRGMLNIGSRPTLANSTDISIEVHIFDFHADIYAEHIGINFLHFVREERKFDSLQALHAQLLRDEAVIRSFEAANH